MNFLEIYNKHSVPFSFPPPNLRFVGDPELNKHICLPCKGRWVQLVAPGGIGKTMQAGIYVNNKATKKQL